MYHKILVPLDGSKRAERILSHVKNLHAGIAANRVDIITTKRKARAGKMILDEANKRNYGTVVVGRRGAKHANFFGSVSQYVTERIANRALWLVS
jgi:nucleotide-binding universal stress UspA family protein